MRQEVSGDVLIWEVGFTSWGAAESSYCRGLSKVRLGTWALVSSGIRSPVGKLHQGNLSDRNHGESLSGVQP